MKAFLLAVLVACASLAAAQNSLTVKLDGKDWKPKTVSAGIEKVMNVNAFSILAQFDKERLDITIDYNSIKGKSSGTFAFVENQLAPPNGASISYAPKGLGKQQWVPARGKLVFTEFNEKTKTASGTFEGTLTQLLNDNGGFILKSPRPTMKVSGKFDKIKFHVVE
jgi:hypothetical protein